MALWRPWRYCRISFRRARQLRGVYILIAAFLGSVALHLIFDEASLLDALPSFIRSVLLLLLPGTVVTEPLTSYVNQFIGTTNGGHVFAGATLPFGVVKAVVNSDSKENLGGYVSDGSPIRGISPLHDDGTGGSPSMGQFQVLPMYCSSLSHCPTAESDRKVSLISETIVGSPGYFGTGLASNITAEVTVSHHAALHRFTFHNYSSSSTDIPTILFDLTNDLGHSFHDTGMLKMEFNRFPGTLRTSGSGSYNPSFGDKDYKVHYCIDIPNVNSAGFYTDNHFQPVYIPTSVLTSDQDSGILVSLSPGALHASGNVAYARIGVSWTSPSQACQYAGTEIPTIGEEAFRSTEVSASNAWENILGTIQVDLSGVSNDTIVNFYSSLYRAYISPMNLTGDNPLWHSSEPYYDSYYCICRHLSTSSLCYRHRTVQAEVVRALIDIYRHLGFLPDCRMSLDKGYTQGGSNADSVLSDSYTKGITEGIDWSDGLAAMIKDATVTPPNWAFEGRGGIERRAQLGYVPLDDDTPNGLMGRSASRTLEYAFNDFGIAITADGLGKADITSHYLNASGDWQHLWNPTTQNSGYSGFIQPRWSDGSWHNVDPRYCSPQLKPHGCYLGDAVEFYEASSWEYSFYVPHDMARLVTLMGGQRTFLDRLDALFDLGFHDMGDEPGFLHPFLYNYAGRPDKTVDRVLILLNTYYNTGFGGIPGNDDSGAMGGFVVFSCFGFYPVAGTGIYLISTPLFRTITYPASTPGKSAVITTVNFDSAVRNKYVVSAKLNGVPFTRNWFAHRELFGKGGTLELTLGPAPSTWGTADADLPPSISTSPLSRFS
ncbi:alpha-1,2-mannosidase, putative subfamily [Cantharellus anzutake]|uniref:alpha-1,2-mannosidase, putative subfamily n=1 Tax=Cantharellus anzutake TaxID=1750568 RepID=UPI00190622D0|nr:alpha-1,2-mannosidase, putative subfamily [Cantharellus anzutake]KAF8331884.1 alpha-1,2-mannosidase, putative subfamily [Cantharellus anzutake]